MLGSTGALTLGPVHHLLRAPPGHRLHGGLGPAGTCPRGTPAPPLPQPARRAPPAADSPPLRLPSPRPRSPPAPRRPGRPPGPAPPAGRGRTRPAAAPPPGAAARLPLAARSWPHGRRASASRAQREPAAPGPAPCVEKCRGESPRGGSGAELSSKWQPPGGPARLGSARGGNGRGGAGRLLREGSDV